MCGTASTCGTAREGARVRARTRAWMLGSARGHTCACTCGHTLVHARASARVLPCASKRASAVMREQARECCHARAKARVLPCASARARAAMQIAFRCANRVFERCTQARAHPLEPDAALVVRAQEAAARRILVVRDERRVGAVAKVDEEDELVDEEAGRQEARHPRVVAAGDGRRKGRKVSILQLGGNFG
eukprot:4144504-Pleurochrysis_carterae.AAC.1